MGEGNGARTRLMMNSILPQAAAVRQGPRTLAVFTDYARDFLVAADPVAARRIARMQAPMSVETEGFFSRKLREQN